MYVKHKDPVNYSHIERGLSIFLSSRDILYKGAKEVQTLGGVFFVPENGFNKFCQTCDTEGIHFDLVVM